MELWGVHVNQVTPASFRISCGFVITCAQPHGLKYLKHVSLGAKEIDMHAFMYTSQVRAYKGSINLTHGTHAELWKVECMITKTLDRHMYYRNTTSNSFTRDIETTALDS
jgi:hypothetical protein